MALALGSFHPSWQRHLLGSLPAAGLKPQGSPGVPEVRVTGSAVCAPLFFPIILNSFFPSKLNMHSRELAVPFLSRADLGLRPELPLA